MIAKHIKPYQFILLTFLLCIQLDGSTAIVYCSLMLKKELSTSTEEYEKKWNEKNSRVLQSKWLQIKVVKSGMCVLLFICENFAG